MTEMLDKLGLKLEGRHHSGIDDCRNIVRIAQQLLTKRGWVPVLTWRRK
jgi:ERI1 exoribonuclease 3